MTTTDEEEYGTWEPFFVTRDIKTRVHYRETRNRLEIKALAPDLAMVVSWLAVSTILAVIAVSSYSDNDFSRGFLIASLGITCGLVALFPFTARWNHVVFQREGDGKSATMTIFKKTLVGVTILRSTTKRDDVRDLCLADGFPTPYRVVAFLENGKKITVFADGLQDVATMVLRKIQGLAWHKFHPDITATREGKEESKKTAIVQKRLTTGFVVLLINTIISIWPFLGLPVPNQPMWDSFISLVDFSGPGLMITSIVGVIMHVLLIISVAADIRFFKEKGEGDGKLFGLIIVFLLGTCCACIVFISAFNGIPFLLLFVGCSLVMPVLD